jgi:hypothetical protein
MQPPFENVREQLLRAGFAPRHARRYVTELQEHLADLTTQQQESGLDAAAAAERARRLLGSDAHLARAMIESGSPRSLAARAPWSVFAVLLPLLLVLITAITNVAMFRLLWPVRELAPSELPAAYTTLIAVVSFASSYLPGPLLATACMAVALRQRVESGWMWTGLVMVALFSAMFGFHVHVVPAVDGGSPGTVFSAIATVYRDGNPDPVATLGGAALRAAALFGIATAAYLLLKRRVIHASATSGNP